MATAESLASQVVDSSDQIYYDPSFKNILEQHLPHFRERALGEYQLTAQLEDNIAVKCDGDFRKVCIELGVPQYLHWLTLRINKLKNYSDYRKTQKTVVLVEDDLLNRLRLIHTTTHQIL